MIESLILTNTVTLQSVLIDKDNSQLVLDEADLGTVEGTHHNYKYVNQIGIHIENTTLEQRTISISGWAIGNTYAELRSNKDILNRLINPLHPIEILLEDTYKLVFKPDYSIQYSAAYSENNEVLCKFLIQGTCADPMFSTKSKQSALVASIIPKFRFPLIIPQSKGVLMGLREPSLLATLTNNGDVDTGITVSFSCTSTVVNPSLLNVDTREMLKINKTLSAGEQVIISTESGSKYVKGYIDGEELNYFKYLDYSSTWLQLHTGLNHFKYGAEENVDGLEVLISFWPRYLEVQ